MGFPSERDFPVLVCMLGGGGSGWAPCLDIVRVGGCQSLPPPPRGLLRNNPRVLGDQNDFL